MTNFNEFLKKKYYSYSLFKKFFASMVAARSIEYWRLMYISNTYYHHTIFFFDK